MLVHWKLVSALRLDGEPIYVLPGTPSDITY